MTTKTVTLNSAIETDGTSIKTLTFREANVGDLMMAGRFEDEISSTCATLAAMCDVPLPAFKQVTARDLKRIMKEVGAMMGNEEATTGA